jgi:NTP pyrophosphatase (non-canonical NTP hydrolase)
MAGYHEDPTEIVLEDVRLERVRQNKKWGEQSHDAGLWYAILGEEFGEVGKAILDGAFERAEGVPQSAYDEAYREELVHVAAVAVAAIENLDRNRAHG